MAGYSPKYSMSNNAIAAYEDGLRPASKIPGVPAVLIKKHCRPAEWHHSSKAYNRVNFYDPSVVRVIFGIEPHEDYEVDPAAVAALAEFKVGKQPVETHLNCRVEWIEWSGTLRRPKATNRAEEGCTVTVKNQTATIALPGGRTLTRRLDTRGFRFNVIKA
jgi:hypothetical protein